MASKPATSGDVQQLHAALRTQRELTKKALDRQEVVNQQTTDTLSAIAAALAAHQAQSAEAFESIHK